MKQKLESILYRLLGLALMVGAAYLPEKMAFAVGPALANYSAFLGGAGLVLFLFPPSSRFSMADLRNPAGRILGLVERWKGGKPLEPPGPPGV